jgi:DNA-nicking Smr family endonuclease
MPRKKLKPDEVELWEQVAKSATPLRLSQYVNSAVKPKPKVNPKKKERFELNNIEIAANATQKSVKNDLQPSI